jgi:hypothetical protein
VDRARQARARRGRNRRRLRDGLRPGYRAWAWFVIGFFGASALCSAWLARIELSRASRVRARVAAIVLDGISVVGFIAVFSYQPSQPYRALYLLPILEAALRFGLVGGFVSAVAMGLALGVVDVLGPGTQVRSTIVRVVVGLFAGVIVGRLSDDLRDDKRAAQARAAEAEKLRDSLGRRVDLLEAASRCSRALASSLDLEEAFGAFIRELRGLVPFDRCAIVLAERGMARIMATAGEGAEEVFPLGSEWPLSDSVTADVLEGATVLQRELGEDSKSDVSPLLAPVAQPACGAAARGAARDRNAVALAARARRVRPGRGRAGGATRPARRERGAEHPRLRGRTAHRRGAPRRARVARRLRLARLARASKPDGCGDRRSEHVAWALARALLGVPGRLPRLDRGRDLASLRSDLRRARHVADGGGHVHVHLQ